MNTSEVKKLEEFFLSSAQRCYVTGEVKKRVSPTGVKYFEVPEGDLVYTDSYSTKGEFSFGATVITVKKPHGIQPLWVLQYQGWCQEDDDRIHSFLKLALGWNYANGTFFAGRGPLDFSDERYRGLLYENHPELPTSFARFRTREQIRNMKEANTPVVFFHNCQGMLLEKIDD